MNFFLISTHFILLTTFICISNGQTTSSKRSQYGFYNNRQFTTKKRIIHSSREPDELFFGFFPLWSAILVSLTGICLLVSLLGVLCYFAGCRNPRRRLMFKKDDSILKQQFELPMSNDDYVSMSMIETMDKHSNKLFSDSRLISTEYEYEINPKTYEKNYEKIKKKRFLMDNL